jgi:RimJ/RimL family protein N-acetyltransferase
VTGSVPVYPPMRVQLQTERLTLRPWAFSDAEDYRVLVAERGDGTPTVADIRERITTQRGAMAQTGIALLPIQRRVEGDFIGYCGLISSRENLDEPEIAYELIQRVHGHGYATEAGRAVVDAAIATGRTRIWSAARGWNTASLRVLEKLGFERDHALADDRGDIVWLTRSLP